MSENSKLVEQLSKCMNEVLSKYSLSKTNKILRRFPQVLNSICTDKKLLNKISMVKSKKGFLNTILGVFGLNLTSMHEQDELNINKNFFKKFVEVDTDKAKNSLESLAREFQNVENDIESEKKKMVDQIAQQDSTNEQLKKEYLDLKNLYMLDKDVYLISMQRLLEEIGPNPVQEGLSKLELIIKQSLEQFGVEVLWVIPDLDNGKLFSIYKTKLNHERMVQQPCFIGKEGLILKGLAYQKV